MVGTVSGVHAVRYGTIKEWILSPAMSNGQVIKIRNRPREPSVGYNLIGLFVGSEGTVGIVTKVSPVS